MKTVLGVLTVVDEKEEEAEEEKGSVTPVRSTRSHPVADLSPSPSKMEALKKEEAAAKKDKDKDKEAGASKGGGWGGRLSSWLGGKTTGNSKM